MALHICMDDGATAWMTTWEQFAADNSDTPAIVAEVAAALADHGSWSDGDMSAALENPWLLDAAREWLGENGDDNPEPVVVLETASEMSDLAFAEIAP